MPKSKPYVNTFITPEDFDNIKKKELSGPNGWLLFVACNSGTAMAEAVKAEYESMLIDKKSGLSEIPLLGGSGNKPITTVFPDTETCPRLPQHVAGSNAYVFQNVHEIISGNSVNENIQQLLQVVRTLRSHRAKTITVVTPYMPYSRQDKPTFFQREATLTTLFADQLKVAGADIHLAYHPHTLSLYGAYEPEMMLISLSGLDLFIDMFAEMKGMEDVAVVSTDAGGAKFAVHYSSAMKVSYAIANKYRKSKDQASLLGIIGELENKRVAIITDDETVTGNSVINAAESLHLNYGVKEIYAAVSHAKIRPEYVERLKHARKHFGLKELHITDTIPQVPALLDLDFVKLHKLSKRFAATINRLHYNQSVRQLSYRPGGHVKLGNDKRKKWK